MVPKVDFMRIRLAAFFVLSSALTSGALAAKLDPVACDVLKAERARLATDALKSDMTKGPDWAKTNLPSERLKEIEQLIGLEEGIAFRCSVPKPAPAAAGVAKAGESSKKAAKAGDSKSGEDKPGEQDTEKAAKPPQTKATENKDAKPVNAKKPKSQQGTTASKQATTPTDGTGAKPAEGNTTKPAEGTGAKSERPPSQKPATTVTKSKPKVSDAYVPPPRDALSFGFASDGPSEPSPALSEPPPAQAPASPSLTP